ncbi:MFS family permease [Actinoplanes campanulatus]|uniref:MFS family permease n=1 Tax=Actinoplanes campanulatus TaxID=113559 RepID=A0A7W5AKN9_9ACTN|nr:MFS transporter [Actinoplanes campanulatus]MBB3098043.1 MFS family permease [Actinoplanes campanulatus]GGN32084.1 putative drug antiporter protein precursor [Actinoplanes campanulatus]GID40085.1 putative drug antiporter protein precursor [Actinoplanes campanulatus]
MTDQAVRVVVAPEPTPAPAVTGRAWRGLAVVLGSQACALSANRMLLIAIPWLLLTSTGDPAKAGLVTLCQALPYVIVQVVVGPLIDRLGARRISIAGDAISAVAMILLAAAPGPPLLMVMLCMACVGAADGPAVAAKHTLLPGATEDAGQPIERGTGMATVIERAATSAGPLASGVLVAAFGARTLWAVAVLFAAAALIGVTGPRAAGRSRAARPGGYLRQLRDGAGFLHRDRSLRAIVLMYVITNFLDQAFLTVLLPVWAHGHGHGVAFVGLLSGVFGACAVFTAAIAAWIGARFPRRTVFLVAIIVAGVSRYVVLAADAPPTVVLLVFAAAGLGSGAACPIVEAVEAERVPDHMRGRVRTLIVAWAWAGIPFGGLAGAAMLAAGPGAALWACGAVYLAAVVHPGLRVTWRR